MKRLRNCARRGIDEKEGAPGRRSISGTIIVNGKRLLGCRPSSGGSIEGASEEKSESAFAM